MNFLFVALGGAVGAAARYAISLIPARTQFPILTLITNLLGAVAIGFIAGLAGKSGRLSDHALLFLKTGMCGGFTTFSTFSLEALSLFEAHSYALCALYVALSTAGCIFGVWCGRKLAALAG